MIICGLSYLFFVVFVRDFFGWRCINKSFVIKCSSKSIKLSLLYLRLSHLRRFSSTFKYLFMGFFSLSAVALTSSWFFFCFILCFVNWSQCIFLIFKSFRQTVVISVHQIWIAFSKLLIYISSESILINREQCAVNVKYINVLTKYLQFKWTLHVYSHKLHIPTPSFKYLNDWVSPLL